VSALTVAFLFEIKWFFFHKTNVLITLYLTRAIVLGPCFDADCYARSLPNSAQYRGLAHRLANYPILARIPHTLPHTAPSSHLALYHRPSRTDHVCSYARMRDTGNSFLVPSISGLNKSFYQIAFCVSEWTLPKTEAALTSRTHNENMLLTNPAITPSNNILQPRKSYYPSLLLTSILPSPYFQ